MNATKTIGTKRIIVAAEDIVAGDTVISAHDPSGTQLVNREAIGAGRQTPKATIVHFVVNFNPTRFAANTNFTIARLRTEEEQAKVDAENLVRQLDTTVARIDKWIAEPNADVESAVAKFQAALVKYADQPTLAVQYCATDLADAEAVSKFKWNLKRTVEHAESRDDYDGEYAKLRLQAVLYVIEETRRDAIRNIAGGSASTNQYANTLTNDRVKAQLEWIGDSGFNYEMGTVLHLTKELNVTALYA